MTYKVYYPEQLVCPKCCNTEFGRCDDYNVSDEEGYIARFYYTCKCKSKITYYWNRKKKVIEMPVEKPRKRRAKPKPSE